MQRQTMVGKFIFFIFLVYSVCSSAADVLGHSQISSPSEAADFGQQLDISRGKYTQYLVTTDPEYTKHRPTNYYNPYPKLGKTIEGAVYIYKRSRISAGNYSDWKLNQTMKFKDNPMSWNMIDFGFDGFGEDIEISISISPSGHWLAIGRTHAGDSTNSTSDRRPGTVEIYQLNSGQFKYHTTIWGSYKYQDFGYSVDITDKYLVVGDPFTEDNYENMGSVVAYKLVGSKWKYHWRINSTLVNKSSVQGNKFFGYDVEIDDKTNNTVLVGMPGSESHLGNAYVFYMDNPKNDYIRVSNPYRQWGDQFGKSVSISNNVLAVCSPNYTSSNRSESGSVSVFYLSKGRAKYVDNYLPYNRSYYDAQSEAHFCSDVSISASSVNKYDIAVGAVDFDDGGARFKKMNSGAVYVYSEHWLSGLTHHRRVSPSAMSGSHQGLAVKMINSYTGREAFSTMKKARSYVGYYSPARIISYPVSGN